MGSTDQNSQGTSYYPVQIQKGKNWKYVSMKDIPISFHKKKYIMKKETNIGENVKKLIYLNTIDRREKGHGLGTTKTKIKIYQVINKETLP